MTPDPAVELVERALAYTRGALLHVRPEHLQRPTPCAGWCLDQLLDHMHDSLDAFTQGAEGTIDVAPPPRALDVRISVLQSTACALLGAWSGSSTPEVVEVGGLPVPTAVVVRAAALEITVHGWDVAQATGHRTPVPAELARALLPVATALVADADRGPRFAAPLVVPVHAGAGARLLAHLGRRPGRSDLTGPVVPDSANRRTRERPAS